MMMGIGVPWKTIHCKLLKKKNSGGRGSSHLMLMVACKTGFNESRQKFQVHMTLD